MRERKFVVDITAKASMTAKEFEDCLDKLGQDLFDYLIEVDDLKCCVGVTTVFPPNMTKGGLCILTGLSKKDLENSIYSHLNVNMFDVEVKRV